MKRLNVLLDGEWVATVYRSHIDSCIDMLELDYGPISDSYTIEEDTVYLVTK